MGTKRRFRYLNCSSKTSQDVFDSRIVLHPYRNHVGYTRNARVATCGLNFFLVGNLGAYRLYYCDAASSGAGATARIFVAVVILALVITIAFAISFPTAALFFVSIDTLLLSLFITQVLPICISRLLIVCHVDYIW